MRVTILGSGPSGGVPLSVGVWGACNPNNTKNRRRRVSIAVRTESTTVIVDTSPDFREQVLDTQIEWIDAVLYTHAHADHLHGIDDLRPFVHRQEKPIDIYLDKPTLDEIQQRFGYTLPDTTRPDLYYTLIEPHLIQGPFQVGDIPVIPFEQDHGYSTSIGYRFGAIAYSTDVVNLSEEAFAALEGIDHWIVDCLEYEERPTHSHLAKTLKWIERVKPKKAYLTHMSHHLDYDTLLKELPPHVVPAYDGLVIDI